MFGREAASRTSEEAVEDELGFSESSVSRC